MVGVRLSVEPPSYVGIRVDARVRARPEADPAQVERDALAALYRYFHPLTGGPDGTGWPLGRPVQPGEVHGVLGRVPGLDYVEDVVLFRANPLDRSISAPQDRIDLGDTHVVLSVEHSIVVAGRCRRERREWAAVGPHRRRRRWWRACRRPSSAATSRRG